MFGQIAMHIAVRLVFEQLEKPLVMNEYYKVIRGAQ